MSSRHEDYFKLHLLYEDRDGRCGNKLFQNRWQGARIEGLGVKQVKDDFTNEGRNDERA